MALTADQITAQNFKDFYTQILPYLNKGNGGTSDTPLGQVAFFDDIVAPYGWLVADGSTYNIADYPDLANQYERVHGSKNYWGGDGTTTFAVPNWQGEFLRASGTNSHANQGSGAAVGVHQDATELPTVGATTANRFFMHRYDSSTSFTPLNSDSAVGTKSSNHLIVTGELQTAPSEGKTGITSRPTNTSLLLCIKAIPSSEMNIYSLTERRVGTYVDGKPLYEKTIVDTMPDTVSTFKAIDIGADVDYINLKHGTMIGSSDGTIATVFFNATTSSGGNPTIVTVNMNTNKISLFTSVSGYASKAVHLTIQYTKTTDV